MDREKNYWLYSKKDKSKNNYSKKMMSKTRKFAL